MAKIHLKKLFLNTAIILSSLVAASSTLENEASNVEKIAISRATVIRNNFDKDVEVVVSGSYQLRTFFRGEQIVPKNQTCTFTADEKLVSKMKSIITSGDVIEVAITFKSTQEEEYDTSTDPLIIKYFLSGRYHQWPTISLCLSALEDEGIDVRLRMWLLEREKKERKGEESSCSPLVASLQSFLNGEFLIDKKELSSTIPNIKLPLISSYLEEEDISQLPETPYIQTLSR